LTDADEERYKYLDQFILEWRRRDRIPAYPISTDDSELIDRMLGAMHAYETFKGLHEDALKEPELTSDTAIEKARMMGTKEKDIGKVAAELLMKDTLDRAGTDRIQPSILFLDLLDKVNARRLILPSEDKIRKLAECEEKNVSLQSIVNQLRADLKKCQDEFADYRHRVRPLDDGKTETGDVGEAPTP
jgi:hypothetical protein